MMKIAAAAALVAVAAAKSVTVTLEVETQPSWSDFKGQFNKIYGSQAEDAKRAAVYADNVDFINAHNAIWAKGESTFNMGVNEHCDLTHDEFKGIFLGPKIARRNVTNAAAKRLRVKFQGTKDSVDWRTKGAVTPVKNQGQCGSCWSFSTTGSTEGRVAIAGNKLVPLSEQQLMDCSTKEGDHSCQGGLMDYGFQYIIDNAGLDSEADYPYVMKNEACDKSKEKSVVATIKSFKDVTPNSEDDLATAVAAGPVSVAIEADQRAFQTYKSGTLSAACGTKLDHGVLAVGYGDDYWIVKNSWGATWGMEGYIQLAKGVGKEGECGIAAQPSYPVAGKGPAPGPGPSPSPPPPPSPPTPPGPGGKTHYEDPNSGPCQADEQAVQITGIQGSFCSPKCGFLRSCTHDVPAGTTAKPTCALETAGSSKPTQCALICDPSALADGCPTDASCKSISGTGLCTYDSMEL
jgi:C1A family cysteine protease